MSLGYDQDSADSVFYAELTRQILLLMDEDDETHARRNMITDRSEYQRRALLAYSGSDGRFVPAHNYFSWSEGGRSAEVPGWMEKLWESKSNNSCGGTGVFIPQVVAAGKSRRRRRNKPRRNNGADSPSGYMIHG